LRDRSTQVALRALAAVMVGGLLLAAERTLPTVAYLVQLLLVISLAPPFLDWLLTRRRTR
jgi:hypothetical protein